MNQSMQEEGYDLAPVLVDGQVIDSSSRQQVETAQALSEMNELWSLKLGELLH